MNVAPKGSDAHLAPVDSALQHSPRPLPLFLQILSDEAKGNPDVLLAALTGLRKFQRAPRAVRRPERPVRYRHDKVELSGFGGNGPKILFVPSLINAPNILDLDENRSLLTWFAKNGFDPLLLNWGRTDASMASHDLDYHITQYLVPLIEQVKEPVHLVGYCLGGTMALAAACLTNVQSLTVIAAPWKFDGYPETRRHDIRGLWAKNHLQCSTLGVFPLEVLQQAFWSLTPDKILSKYVQFGQPDIAAKQIDDFVILEDWTNSGEPLAYGAGKQLIDDFFLGNATGQDMWSIEDQLISPTELNCVSLAIASRTDQIVAHATTADLSDRMDLQSGHVGMIVGGRGREQLWKPLHRWLSDNS